MICYTLSHCLCVFFQASASSFDIKTELVHSYKQSGGTKDYVVQWGDLNKMPKGEEKLKLEGENWKVLLPIFHANEEFAWRELHHDDPMRECLKKVEKYELLRAVSKIFDDLVELPVSQVFSLREAPFPVLSLKYTYLA